MGQFRHGSAPSTVRLRRTAALSAAAQLKSRIAVIDKFAARAQ